MASDDGNSFNRVVVKDAHKHVPDTYQEIYRSVYWARYVDWSVTTPLLLLDLSFLAGLNGANMIVAIVADIIMILTGLFAAFGSEGGQKWGMSMRHLSLAIPCPIRMSRPTASISWDGC
jgi:bacteriorhodopsin